MAYEDYSLFQDGTDYSLGNYSEFFSTDFSSPETAYTFGNSAVDNYNGSAGIDYSSLFSSDYSGGNGSEFFGDTIIPDQSYTSGGGSSTGGALSSALKWLGGDGGANLGSALLGGYELYDKYDTNKDVKELLAQQLYNSENDQYRAFTGQAGEHTRDAYTTGLNQQKMDLMMSLMANDKHLPEADRTRLMSGMSGVTDRYAPAFEGYANDNIGRRNAKYSADYNSQMPFPVQQPVAQQGPLAQTQSVDYMKGIPEGTDPAMAAAYQKYLGL